MVKKKNAKHTDSPAAAVGPLLQSSQYDAAVNFLFDRPVPATKFDGEWYWNPDETCFNMTPLEWVCFQKTLFQRCGADLSHFSDQQVGMGLHYLMDSGLSDVAMSILHPTVPKHEALEMIQCFPALWSDCIGPRLREVCAPIGACTGGRLGYVCYMWFDVWPVPYLTSTDTDWNAATWCALKTLLRIDVREVQIAALHGIGHCAVGRGFDAEIEATVREFRLKLKDTDPELASYAKAAARGMVQ